MYLFVELCYKNIFDLFSLTVEIYFPKTYISTLLFDGDLYLTHFIWEEFLLYIFDGDRSDLIFKTSPYYIMHVWLIIIHAGTRMNKYMI